MNVYDPYLDHKPFWDNFVITIVFDIHPIILGGDMNFTTMIREVQGNTIERHPLEEYFSHFIIYSNIIDMEHVSLIPMWRSSRSNEE